MWGDSRGRRQGMLDKQRKLSEDLEEIGPREGAVCDTST